VIVSEPEFVEFADDESGASEWLDSPETLGGNGPHRSRRLRFSVVAGVVVAALAATALILQANHDFGPGPDSRAAVGSVDWRATLPGPSVGMWTTADSVVLATVKGLTTYSLSGGKKLWSWAPPTGDGLCAMSPTTSQGRGVVAFGAFDAAEPNQPGACTAVQTIDVGTGHAAWPEPADLTQGGSPAFGSPDMNELSISDGFVLAPYGPNGLVSLDAATGARLWSSGGLPGRDVGASGICAERGAQTSGGEVYALSGNTCSGAGISVLVYGATKLATPQVVPLPDDSPHCAASARELFATAADVLVTCSTYGGQSYAAYAIAQGTAQLTPLAVQGFGGIAPVSVAAQTGQSGQLALAGGFVSGGSLVIESQRAAGPVTALTGFDLSTGTELWQHSFPAGTRFYPLGPGAGGALGVQTAGSDWTLLSTSPTTGATAPTASLDSKALSGSGLDGSFDYAVVGSYVVAAQLGTNATVIVSTL
jgi:hypothetical protein